MDGKLRKVCWTNLILPEIEGSTEEAVSQVVKKACTQYDPMLEFKKGLNNQCSLLKADNIQINRNRYKNVSPFYLKNDFVTFVNTVVLDIKENSER